MRLLLFLIGDETMPNKSISELEQLLEQAPEVPLKGGKKISVIDWNALKTKYVRKGYFTIPDVQEEIEKQFKTSGIEGKVHYSQVLGWLQRLGAKDKTYNVVKKKLVGGDNSGVYYRFVTRPQPEPKPE